MIRRQLLLERNSIFSFLRTVAEAAREPAVLRVEMPVLATVASRIPERTVFSRQRKLLMQELKGHQKLPLNLIFSSRA